MYAEVLIEYNAKSVDKTFTYLIPDKLKDKLKVGMKVIVPFGIGKRNIHGFVVKIVDEYDLDYKLKEIDSIEDDNFCLNEELMALGSYLQEKTLCSKITAYQTMLPSSLKVKEQKNNYSKYLVYVELVKDDDVIKEFITKYPRRGKAKEVIELLKKEGKVLRSNISYEVLKQLKEANLVIETKEQVYRLCSKSSSSSNVKFTSDQENAINSVLLDSEQTYLLHGVTGSGKTEVYIELIKRTIKKGRSAIMLVPEISLTTQIINKFYSHFGNDVAIFHSGLSSGEKYDEYLKILRDEVHIVVGTRSAIFTPLNNLGIIIIDEEHSETFKQDTTPRYHALDMALFRSHYNHIPIVLGSATPSLESMARALKGVYKYIRMPNRVGVALLPDVMIVDMALEMKKRNLIFSDVLKDKIRDKLEKKEQIILLLNRRGYSTIISCKSCGYTFKCPHCDIALTYHKTTDNLRCHYCGYTMYKTLECPNCHEKALTDYGLGTEKLEMEISKLFPEARIVRMDADTTRNKGAHEDIINKFKNHEYDILLGTQMISKGLDFPLVTLVGVINADATLNMPDFRSGERTFSLLSQVAGRAGRSNLPGEVIIQTFNPDNFTLECVKENDYMKFYQYEMNNRHKLDYPPYYFITSINVASLNYELALKEINKVKKYLENNLSKKVIILGPTPAQIFKINNIYRYKLILKYKREDNLLRVLKELDNIYITNMKVNLEIDNNPLQV